MTYKIIRYYAPHKNKPNEVVKTGLTLEDAREHCRREDTTVPGEWFDGYIEEEAGEYNGFKNRSTWLARVHLENTSPEVLRVAQALAQKDREIRADKSQWKGISYPHWQLLGNEKAAEELLMSRTNFRLEEWALRTEIRWPEVFDAILSDV